MSVSIEDLINERDKVYQILRSNHRDTFFHAYFISILSMQEVAERIKLKDTEAAKRWCVSNDITVFRLAKKDVVYQFHVDYVLAKPLVDDLKSKHPENWQEVLCDVLDCESLCNYFIRTSEETFAEPDAIKGVDQDQEKLLKRLLK